MKFVQELQNENLLSADFKIRRKIVLILFLLGMGALVGRAVFLQVFKQQFLHEKSLIQYVSEVALPGFRGQILDRNNEPLAISTPMESVCFENPPVIEKEREKFRQVAELLNVPKIKTEKIINKGKGKFFTYLKRRVHPTLVKQIKALNVKGICFKKEYKRYYPAGAVSAHVVGFTNIEDAGQEGMERGYEQSLKGTKGKKKVIRDRKRRVVEDIAYISEPVSGQDLVLSLDQRIQYVAFKELQKAVVEHKAESASLIVLDAKNGEILAAVNQPAFNPNIRKDLKGELYRNRAMLNAFEPGSVVKPFVVAAALDGDYIKEDIQIETHGFFRVGRNLVKDVKNYKTLGLTDVLKKSSNVAVSKIALKMSAEELWQVYNQLGFGVATYAGFPGEVSGKLPDYHDWNEFKQATLSFGYALSTSVLQLARAYTALADNGILHSVSLLKREQDDDAKRVFSEQTAKKVTNMLEHVVKKDGTAPQARVDGYRVAGKTGTVKKTKIEGGYEEKSYVAVFVGLAPVSNPRFVIAVMVDNPRAGKYYGGQVAAPVFSKVMSGALRVYGVAPDQEETMPVLLTSTE